LSENLLERQLVAAVRFARQGDKTRARPLLEEILKQERSNEQAWIWLASVVDSPKERRVCIERVLKINPRNAPAQAALNTMVGVLAGGEQPKVDYEAISKAAAKPLPVTGTRREAPPPPRNLAGGERRSIRPLLIGAAVVLAILFILSLLPAAGIFTDLPTETPTEFIEITEEPSATIDPLFTPPSPTVAATATFDGVFVEVTRAVTLPPTFTPTVTATATDTPTPTATLPGLTNYNWLLLGTQGTSLPAIYRVNGNGEGLTVFIANINEFDYDISTGLLAFTEPSEVTAEDGTITIVSRMFVAPIGNIGDRQEVTSSSIPNAISPAFSPDGTRLAFASDAGGDYEIYVYDVNTQLSRQITDNIGDDIDPDWSPAGSNLVYASDLNTPNRFQIFNISATETGVEPVQITRVSSSNRHPAWSPTSGMIAFMAQDDESTEIMLTDANGSFVRSLSFIPSHVYSEPAWTLDGIYVVFSAGPAGETHPLYLVPAESGPTQEIEIADLSIRRVIQR